MNANLPVSEQKTKIGWLELLGLLVGLSLAAYMRLANLENNPGWYSDEGTLINIADNLLHGRWQYLSINQSVLIVARPPLFVSLLSGIFSVFGTGIIALRGFTGGLGVLAVLLVYLLVRRVNKGHNPGLALLSALMLAIYPQAVLYSRLGFSYNLLAVLVLLAILGLWNYLDTHRFGWLVFGCLAIGLGSISDLLMLMLLPSVLLILSTRGWRSMIWGLTWMCLPWLIWAAWMFGKVPGAFLFDTQYTLSRLSSIPLLIQLPVVLLNYYYMLIHDAWFLVGVMGLFLVDPLRWRYLLLTMFLLPLIFLGRSIGYAVGWEYYLIPFFPLVAVGLACLVWKAVPFVVHTFQSGFHSLWQAWGWQFPGADWFQARATALVSSLGLFLVVLSPLLISLVFSVQDVQGMMETRIDPILVDASDARQVVSYLNQRVDADDLVVASAAVAWLIHSRVADFQQSLAAQGISSLHLPGDLPSERFAFDPRYTQAKYVLVDRIWRNWGVEMIPELVDMLEEVQTWEREYSVGEFDVYRNPDQ